jgi:hypothetical protein
MTWKITRWPLDVVRVTSPFGMRKHPITGKMRFHNGVDLGAPMYTELYPVRDGVVVKVGYDETSGLYIVYDDDDGHRYSYSHCSSTLFAEGDRITTTEAIALVGTSGLSTGPHLHWVARPSRTADPIDPMTLIVAEESSGGGLVALGAAALAVVGAGFALGDAGSDGDLYVSEQDVHDRVDELSSAANKLVLLSTNVLTGAQANALINLYKLARRVALEDVPAILEQGRVVDAYNLATNTLRAVNDVLNVEGRYDLAVGMYDVVRETASDALVVVGSVARPVGIGLGIGIALALVLALGGSRR